MKLKGMTWDHARGYECLIAASAAYKKETNVEIEWNKRSLQAFADHPIEELAEHYDFIVLDHPHVGKIAETGALLTLPPIEKKSESLGGSAESYIWRDQCWAYAIDAACQMAVYRPDLDSPLPTHWENFLDKNASRYRAITPLLPVDAFDMLMTLVAGRGEHKLPFSSKQFVSDKNGEYALDMLRTLYNLGPEDAISMNPIDVLETLATSNEFSCSPCLFGYINYARPNFRSHRLEYFDLPLAEGQSRTQAILGGAGIGISKQTREPKAALEFAKWVTSEPIQSGIYVQNDGQPANRNSWLNKQNDPDYSGFFGGGFNTIDNAWTRPRDPWFLDFVDDACEMMPHFFKNKQSVQSFLVTLNNAYKHHTSGV